MAFSKETTVRSLSNIETLMANGHACRQSTSQFVTLLHLNCRLNTVDLEEIYTHLCKEDPIFSSKLQCVDGKWVIKSLPKKDVFSFTITKHSALPKPNDTLLEAELNSPLDYTKETIRLNILTSPERNEHIWLLTLHHGIADVFTAKRFLSALLYNATLPAFKKFDISPSYYLHPNKPDSNLNLEKNLPTPNSNADLISSLRKIAPSSEKISTAVRTIVCPKETLHALTNQAKKNNFSLNSLLTAICAQATQSLLGISSVETLSAVSNRGDLSPLQDTGCFIDIAAITLNNTIWKEEAAHFDQKLRLSKKEFHAQQNTHNTQIEATKTPIPLSRDYAIQSCAGIGFTNNGDITKIQRPLGVEILTYRSIANRNSGDMVAVFHFSFLNKQLVISLAIPTLLLGDSHQKMFVQLIKNSINQIAQEN